MDDNLVTTSPSGESMHGGEHLSWRHADLAAFEFGQPWKYRSLPLAERLQAPLIRRPLLLCHVHQCLRPTALMRGMAGRLAPNCIDDYGRGEDARSGEVIAAETAPPVRMMGWRVSMYVPR
jgi:hypothetical protein